MRWVKLLIAFSKSTSSEFMGTILTEFPTHLRMGVSAFSITKAMFTCASTKVSAYHLRLVSDISRRRLANFMRCIQLVFVR